MCIYPYITFACCVYTDAEKCGWNEGDRREGGAGLTQDAQEVSYLSFCGVVLTVALPQQRVRYAIGLTTGELLALYHSNNILHTHTHTHTHTTIVSLIRRFIYLNPPTQAKVAKSGKKLFSKLASKDGQTMEEPKSSGEFQGTVV